MRPIHGGIWQWVCPCLAIILTHVQTVWCVISAKIGMQKLEAEVHKIMTTTHRTATTTDKTVTTTQKMGASMKLDARAVIAVGLKWEST